jgi:CPA2 family monovalent cation:H+ antiporter-2
MDHTAGPILEIGLVLLGAVAAGWLARRVGLPAIVGYLALGLLVSPFTPGYVADHDQLQLLADVGVVLLLFGVGIEVDILRIRSEQHGLLIAAPAQTLATTAIAGGALFVAGLQPVAAALIGLSIAPSSSVVIVNFGRRRGRVDHPRDLRRVDRGGRIEHRGEHRARADRGTAEGNAGPLGGSHRMNDRRRAA